MEERQLPGGNAGGAWLVDGTVRRPTGPWTPAVHALLRHLAARDFQGAPRVLGGENGVGKHGVGKHGVGNHGVNMHGVDEYGFDEHGREVLSFLPGATVGFDRPWPGWVHSDEALVQVGTWLRRYHNAVIDFVPPAGARWRSSLRPWRPGDVVGHNDAAPYNAVWEPTAAGHDLSRAEIQGSGGRLVGFIDWDFAAPCSPLWDLAFVVFSWVPLHARDVARAEGFTSFADRPRRLRLLLDAYGYTGTMTAVLDSVRARIQEHARGLRELAAAGDPLFTRLVEDGVIDGLDRALVQLNADAATFNSAGNVCRHGWS